MEGWGGGGYATKSKNPARICPHKRVFLPILVRLGQNSRGALRVGWNSRYPNRNSSDSHFPQKVFGFRTALGSLTCASSNPLWHSTLPRAEGASLWVEGNSLPPERAGPQKLLMPRGATRPDILATKPSLTGGQTAAQRSYATSPRLHNDSLTKPGFYRSVRSREPHEPKNLSPGE